MWVVVALTCRTAELTTHILQHVPVWYIYIYIYIYIALADQEYLLTIAIIVGYGLWSLTVQRGPDLQSVVRVVESTPNFYLKPMEAIR